MRLISHHVTIFIDHIGIRNMRNNQYKLLFTSSDRREIIWMSTFLTGFFSFVIINTNYTTRTGREDTSLVAKILQIILAGFVIFSVF